MITQRQTMTTELLNAESAENAEKSNSTSETRSLLISLRSLLPLRFKSSLVLAYAVMWSTALADDGIVVRGSGSASGRPTQVEMSATISADAELAADAIVKFRDAKKRALAAVAGLKNPDLSVIPGGVSVGSGTDANAQMMAMRGMAVPNTTQKVRLSETSRVVLAHADKLEPDELLEKLLKILDVAKDAGFVLGPAPASNYIEMQIRAQEGEAGSATVSFRLPDASTLRDQAYQAAIDDAKAKAQKLADLSGGKLGRIVAVHDEGTAKADPEISALMMIYGATMNKVNADDKALSGVTSGELTLRVNLTVQFEIAK
jgi:uncharacterized protein